MAAAMRAHQTPMVSRMQYAQPLRAAYAVGFLHLSVVNVVPTKLHASRRQLPPLMFLKVPSSHMVRRPFPQ